MDESVLYNLLYDGLLQKWREEIEKTENESWFFTNEQDTLKKLEAELDEKNRKLLTSYSIAIENRLDFVHRNLKFKVLNLGIKIGIDLQKAFTEFEE